MAEEKLDLFYDVFRPYQKNRIPSWLVDYFYLGLDLTHSCVYSVCHFWPLKFLVGDREQRGASMDRMYIAVLRMLHREIDTNIWKASLPNDPVSVFQHQDSDKWNIFNEYQWPHTHITLVLKTPVSTVWFGIDFQSVWYGVNLCQLRYWITFSYWAKDPIESLREATFTLRFFEHELRAGIRMFLELCRTQTTVVGSGINLTYLAGKKACIACRLKYSRGRTCTGCKKATYCSAACEEKDGPIHKNYCAALTSVAPLSNG
jgi:hypothetical protein